MVKKIILLICGLLAIGITLNGCYTILKEPLISYSDEPYCPGDQDCLYCHEHYQEPHPPPIIILIPVPQEPNPSPSPPDGHWKEIEPEQQPDRRRGLDKSTKQKKYDSSEKHKPAGIADINNNNSDLSSKPDKAPMEKETKLAHKKQDSK